MGLLWMSSRRPSLAAPNPTHPPARPAQLPGDHKLLAADTAADFKALLRHLADGSGGAPHWRQHRPAVMVERAEFRAEQQQQGGSEGGAATGTLLLRGYVRGLGLSANQAVHVPGAGDFQLSHIEGPPEPAPANDASAAGGGSLRQQQGQQGAATQQQGGAGMDTDVQLDGASGLPVLARPDPQAQEPLVRENEVDPLAGEQTWPTEEVRWVQGAARWCWVPGGADRAASLCAPQRSIHPLRLTHACLLLPCQPSAPTAGATGGGGGAQGAQAAPAPRHL